MPPSASTRGERAALPLPYTGRGARTNDHRGQDPRPFQACSLTPPNGGGWSPSATCGGGSCSFFLSKDVGGGVFLRLAEGSGPSRLPTHRFLCNRLPATFPRTSAALYKCPPSLPLIRSIRMWMLAFCDLRWMHGSVVVLAASDGETPCLKVRSTKSGRTKLAEPISSGTVRFHLSLKQRLHVQPPTLREHKD